MRSRAGHSNHSNSEGEDTFIFVLHFHFHFHSKLRTTSIHITHTHRERKLYELALGICICMKYQVNQAVFISTPIGVGGDWLRWDGSAPVLPYLLREEVVWRGRRLIWWWIIDIDIEERSNIEYRIATSALRTYAISHLI